MKKELLWSILSLGLGSFLTLLSCFYTSQPTPMFVDQVPSAYESVQVGYPFPVFSSHSELWDSGQFYSHARFVWLGALFDLAIYAFIVFVVISVAAAIAIEAKARKTRFTE